MAAIIALRNVGMTGVDVTAQATQFLLGRSRQPHAPVRQPSHASRGRVSYCARSIGGQESSRVAIEWRRRVA